MRKVYDESVKFWVDLMHRYYFNLLFYISILYSDHLVNGPLFNGDVRLTDDRPSVNQDMRLHENGKICLLHKKSSLKFFVHFRSGQIFSLFY
jgi:hypothetical protein